MLRLLTAARMRHAQFAKVLAAASADGVPTETPQDEMRSLQPLLPAPPSGSPNAVRTHSPLTGNSLGTRALQLQETVKDYPVVGRIGEISDMLWARTVTIIAGDTGSGKTTQVPQIAGELVRRHFAVTGHWLGQVLIAIPARAATERQFARVCEEADVQPGRWAACRTHMRKVGDANAALMFMTQGYLARIIHQGILEKVSFIILDDTQIKSEELSFICSLLRRRLDTITGDGDEWAPGANAPGGIWPRVVLMSAESNFDEARSLFGPDIGLLTVSGRRFQVNRCEFRKEPAGDTAVAIDKAILQRVVERARAYMSRGPDVILIFVKGTAEIVEVTGLLDTPGWALMPLHARMERNAMQEVLCLPECAKSIVIVSTNVAETAVTIQPVKVVISSCRVNRKEVGDDGIDRVTTEWVSQAEINQQGGRAGRVAEGEQCLCSPYATLRKARRAEISIAGDKRWLVFELVNMGLQLKDLHWMPGQAPSENVYRRAEQQLLQLRLLEGAFAHETPGSSCHQDHDALALEVLAPQSFPVPSAPVPRDLDMSTCAFAMKQTMHGPLRVSSRGEQVMRLGMVDSLHMAHFVILSNEKGAGYEACAAVAYLQTLMSQPMFADTYVGLQPLRDSVFANTESDIVLAAKIVPAYAASANREGFCEEYNLKQRSMQDALQLYRHIGEARLTWTWWQGTDAALADVLERAMTTAGPEQVAFASAVHMGCHQTAHGTYVKCAATSAKEHQVVLPLDMRVTLWKVAATARLAILLPSPRAPVVSSLVLSDSFLQIGYQRRSMQSVASERLRAEGYGEIVWHCKGGMSFDNACSFLRSFHACFDAGVIVYNINDALQSNVVRGFTEYHWESLGKLIGLLADRCRRLTFVLPTSALYPKFHHVAGYEDARDALRRRLESGGIRCVEAFELRGKTATYDGEHFDEQAEPALANCLVHWMRDAACLDKALLEGLAIRDEDETASGTSALSVKKQRTGETGAAQSKSFPSVDGLVLDVTLGPWYLRRNEHNGCHYVHCAVCLKRGVGTCGDENHAATQRHQNNVAFYCAKSEPFRPSWNKGWSLVADAPSAMTMQHASLKYELDLFPGSSCTASSCLEC